MFGVRCTCLALPLLVHSWSFALRASWSYLSNRMIFLDRRVVGQSSAEACRQVPGPSFRGFHPTKMHVDGGNYYGDVIILNYLHVTVILILICLGTTRWDELIVIKYLYSTRPIKTSSRASCI